MISFFVTLGRFIGAVITNGVRWVFRSRRNFFLALGGVFLMTVLYLGGKGLFAPAPAPVSEAPAPVAPEGWQTLSASPVPTGGAGASEGASSASSTPSAGGVSSASASPSGVPTATGPDTPNDDGKGKQAVQTAPAPSVAPATVKQPAKPSPKREDAEAVAKAWLTAATARPDESGQPGLDWMKPWSSEELYGQMGGKNPPQNGLEGLAPAAPVSITLKPAEAGAGRDTPARFTRTAEVTVQTATAGRFIITYSIQLTRTDEGWTVSSAEPLYWTGAKR